MQTTEVYELSEQEPQLPSWSENSRKFDGVLSSHLSRFRRIAFRKLRNPADAEDAVQDALLAAYKHLDQFEGHSQMSTWLTAIVMNCSRMQLRRRLRHIYISLDDPVGEGQTHSLSDEIVDHAPGPEHECRDAELYQRAVSAMNELSPQLRATLRLRYLEGHTVRETANILGVPRGTVKARLFRARVQLRELMHGPRGARRRSAAARARSAQSARSARTSPRFYSPADADLVCT